MSNQWLFDELKKLQKQGQIYEVDALLIEITKLLEEQEKRIEQYSGQIDGTLWSPGQW